MNTENLNLSKTNLNWNIVFVCWLISCVAALGSLFFSHVLGFPPCVLCWYQRIFLFPLVFIFLAGLFPFNKDVFKFAFPLTLTGWGISLYHNLLYTGIIPKSLQPCGKGISCVEDNLNLFGFVTIPMLSFAAFSTLIVLLIILRRRPSQ